MSTTWTRIYGQRWETYLLNDSIVPAVCYQVERFWLLEETLGKAIPSEWTWQLLRTTVTCSHFLQSNLASLYRSGNTFLFSVFIFCTGVLLFARHYTLLGWAVPLPDLTCMSVDSLSGCTTQPICPWLEIYSPSYQLLPLGKTLTRFGRNGKSPSFPQ